MDFFIGAALADAVFEGGCIRCGCGSEEFLIEYRRRRRRVVVVTCVTSVEPVHVTVRMEPAGSERMHLLLESVRIHIHRLLLMLLLMMMMLMLLLLMLVLLCRVRMLDIGSRMVVVFAENQFPRHSKSGA